MSMQSFKARPLSVLKTAGTDPTHSQVFDIGGAIELYMQLKVTARDQNLTVKWQTTVDGLHWADGTTQFAAATGPTVEVIKASGSIYRYLRFEYTTAAAGTATFELDVFSKNYD